jgi:hypothetical protein
VDPVPNRVLPHKTTAPSYSRTNPAFHVTRKFITVVAIKTYQNNFNYWSKGHYLPTRRPGFELRSGHAGFVADKVALVQVFSSTSVSLANLHSANCFTIIITIYQQTSNGCSTKWTQSHPTTNNNTHGKTQNTE